MVQGFDYGRELHLGVQASQFVVLELALLVYHVSRLSPEMADEQHPVHIPMSCPGSRAPNILN